MEIDSMKLKHDKRADAAYIHLSSDPYSYGKDIDNERRIDYDVNGEPIGVELLCVSTGVITEGLPHRPEIETLLPEHNIQMLEHNIRINKRDYGA